MLLNRVCGNPVRSRGSVADQLGKGDVVAEALTNSASMCRSHPAVVPVEDEALQQACGSKLWLTHLLCATNNKGRLHPVDDITINEGIVLPIEDLSLMFDLTDVIAVA